MYEAPNTPDLIITRMESLLAQKDGQIDQATKRIIALDQEVERLHDEIATIKANVLEAIK